MLDFALLNPSVRRGQGCQLLFKLDEPLFFALRRDLFVSFVRLDTTPLLPFLFWKGAVEGSLCLLRPRSWVSR